MDALGSLEEIAEQTTVSVGPDVLTRQITSYVDLVNGINAQREALGVRMIDFDDLAGFPAGLSGKAFGPAKVKRLGSEKLFDALRAAGLALKLEPDPEQLKRMRKRITENFDPRQEKQARPNNQANIDRKTVDCVLIYLTTKKGGLTRLNGAVKEARSNWARHAAKARVFRKYLTDPRHCGLPPPENREALNSCVEEEATAA